jgi:hypothetical protein
MRRRQGKPDLLRDASVVCTETFKPQPVSRWIERGRVFKRDDSIVNQFPQFFAVQVPFAAVIEAEAERSE